MILLPFAEFIVMSTDNFCDYISTSGMYILWYLTLIQRHRKGFLIGGWSMYLKYSYRIYRVGMAQTIDNINRLYYLCTD